MNATLTRVLTIAMAAALGACASPGSHTPPVKQLLSEVTGQDGRACIRQSAIRGYGILDHNIVSIDAGNDYYIATVLPGCINLETSVRAIFRSSSAFELCGGRMDKVVTREDNCIINQIFEFENREAAMSAYNAAVENR